ncbi:hypothetical protein LTR17_018820 [Elasticomyces elasticus]|nr:hypothetical protein LTR17_018820 [Elasticomyces elasticus]
MKFGQEYQKVLATEKFPDQWLDSAIDYKHLKKCIKKIHRELHDLGLDAKTISYLSEHLNSEENHVTVQDHELYAVKEPQLATISEEFTPQLRVLVDVKTGNPIDATLSPETKATLKSLARHEIATTAQFAHLGHHAVHEVHGSLADRIADERRESLVPEIPDARWILVPLSTAKEFFNMLAPKLAELEQLRELQTRELEEKILDLGELIENVVQPVREGWESKRQMSYRDLYFWREMFRLYIEHPIFYSSTEQNRGALTFYEAKSRMESYDRKLRETGLLAKMKTPQALLASQRFLDLNVEILRNMRFQEMNAQAMTKILKKFNKRTHLEGQQFRQELVSKYPALLPPSNRNGAGGAGGFANSIARDMHAEISSKVLSIVPQVDEWNCPVCYEMAWRPADHVQRCPTCNAETVARADGRHINYEAMDFLEKYFPMETKQRQKENEKADLEMRYGENFTKPGCTTM